MNHCKITLRPLRLRTYFLAVRFLQFDLPNHEKGGPVTPKESFAFVLAASSNLELTLGATCACTYLQRMRSRPPLPQILSNISLRGLKTTSITHEGVLSVIYMYIYIARMHASMSLKLSLHHLKNSTAQHRLKVQRPWNSTSLG